MNSIPGVLIVSSSNTKPKSLIKLITKSSDITDNNETPGLIKHFWTIDTKYYTANINLFGLEDDFERSEEFNNSIEALVILMDSNKQTGLEELNRWDVFDNDCSLEVKLLVANYCNSETKINKNEALEWCLKRGFEFIELYPSNTQQELDDELIKEKFGIDRVVEALQSHTWSNLVMKTKDKPNKNRGTNKPVQASKEILKHNEDIVHCDDVDDFTELFSQLHLMKDSLQSMPMNQRKQCAEHMVTAFWKAIGGEEEELLDI